MKRTKIHTTLSAAVALLALLALLPARASAQEEVATVRVVPQATSVDEGEELVVDILVENVSDLGGFQAVLTFDPERLEYLSSTRAEWIGSTGREVVCPDPTVDPAAVLVRCVTLREEPSPVSGSGALYQVRFNALAGGDTDLSISRVRLVQPDGTDVVNGLQLEPARVSVNGGGGGFPRSRILIAGGVIVLLGVAAAAVVVVRRRTTERVPGAGFD
jgi:hypothetical protein